jgi:hypothetical protein
VDLLTGGTTEDVTRPLGRTPVQGGPAAPVQVAPVQVTPVQVMPVQVAPVPVAATPAATANLPGDGEGSAAPPAAESPPVAPKRPVHRRRPQEDPFPVKKWLQQIGVLPPN